MENIEMILYLHQKWLNGDSEGKKADLTKADLTGADLTNAKLNRANLTGAKLTGAKLTGAKLTGAKLTGADLTNAKLNRADLTGADLTGTDLIGADIENIIVSNTTSFYFLQCPSSGSYIAYKKAEKYIIKLEIPADAKRSSATTRKCRASKAKVLSIEEIDGTPADIKSICSDRDKNFVYTVGETVEVKDFEENRWIECAAGIHHFITREEAVLYNT